MALSGTELGRVLRDQDLVISRGQALRCGLTLSQLRHRIRPGGPWQRLLPGVYLAATGTPTARQREIAALRLAGAGSAITGVTALRKHGVRVPDAMTITVLVPATRPRESTAFARIWPTTRMPEFVLADGAVRFTQAARAVVDASRELASFREMRAVTADAVQRRRCEIDQLADELACAPVRHSAWLRQALGEVATGIRSAAEGDLHDLISRTGLPIPLFNARLYLNGRLLAIADAWWPGAGVVAEVESREWHISPEDWAKTLRRSARLSAQGIIVLHVTPGQIRDEPDRVAADIRSALSAGLARAPLAIQALPAAS